MPDEAKFAWHVALASEGHGGVAATKDVVVAGGRDLADFADVFTAVDAASGELLWQHLYPAFGKLDYGNAPRATPLIDGQRVYLLGALGQLHCLDLKTGLPIWARHLADDFGAKAPKWGFSASPLLFDGKLIVQPGAVDAAIVALDPATGKTIWKAPGRSGGYGSLMPMKVGTHIQLIGYDIKSLGGWDPASGRRLWELVPPEPDDFNVPTPIVVGERVCVSTENNGTRVYEFLADGRINPAPMAQFSPLAPDTHTPVVVGRKLFGVKNGLYCLDLEHRLQPLWRRQERDLLPHASLIADNERLLILTFAGKLKLIDATADVYTLLDELTLTDDGTEYYSHPAIVGDRLYLRRGRSLCCLPLRGDVSD